MNKQIRNYVKEHIRQGFHQESATKVLMKAGFSKKDIDEAFSHYHHQHQMLKISLVVIVALLFLAVAIMFVPKQEKAPLGTVQEAVSIPSKLSEKEFTSLINEVVQNPTDSLCSPLKDTEQKGICLNVSYEFRMLKEVQGGVK